MKDVHIEQTAFVELKPNQPQHFSTYQSEIIYHLRNFLSLGTGTAVLPLVVKAKNRNCTFESTTGQSPLRDIYIFYAAQGAALDEKKLAAQDIILGYQDIADQFQRYYENWLIKAEKLLPVFDLYFGLFYIPSMYVHLELLTLAQALETYHRQMYDGVFMPPDQYQIIRETLNQAIPQTLDADHRKSLESRIQYGYEYSLRKRLKHILTDVLAPYRSIVDRLVGKHSTFINDLVSTRNYLTHHTDELENSAITDPQGQYNLVQKMKLLMQLCLFIELDLPVDNVEKLASEKHKFRRWLQ